jgi:hypothetical protein
MLLAKNRRVNEARHFAAGGMPLALIASTTTWQTGATPRGSDVDFEPPATGLSAQSRLELAEELALRFVYGGWTRVDRDRLGSRPRARPWPEPTFRRGVACS